MGIDLQSLTDSAPMIPGAYERNTLTRRQPGSMGGPGFGSTGIPLGATLMDTSTAAERHKEGGGASHTAGSKHKGVTDGR